MMRTIAAENAAVFDNQIEGDQCLIAHAYRWHEAALAVSLLRASGLSVSVLDGQAHAAMPETGVALGGMRIVVPASQRSEALALLASVPLPRASMSAWAKLILVGMFLWIGAFSMRNVAPMMSGLYLRRPEADGSALG